MREEKAGGGEEERKKDGRYFLKRDKSREREKKGRYRFGGKKRKTMIGKEGKRQKRESKVENKIKTTVK